MFEKQKIEPKPEKDESGVAIITKKYIRDYCEYNEQYDTPHLNTKLVLPCKGWVKIQNLEEYFNIKALFLENNMISKIENIDFMKQLRSLFLQHNMIKKMEGLSNFVQLDTLDLTGNVITKIEGISNLENLTKLYISENAIEDLSGFDQVHFNAKLTSLDLSNNLINEYDPKIFEYLKKLKNMLKSLM